MWFYHFINETFHPLSKETRVDVVLKRDNTEGIDWQKAKDVGIYNHLLKTALPFTCGKLLSHCKAKVTAFREKVGIRLCVFKLGVTACPINRFELYHKKGFSEMWLIATSSSIDLIHMLESALISEFHKHVGCKNVEGSGGEGALNRVKPAPPPYFVYVTGGRADQRRWVG